MNFGIHPKASIENNKIGFSVKKVISLCFILAFISIAIAGCYYLNKEAVTAANGFHEPESKVSGIIPNSDFVLVKQNESEPTFSVVDSTGAIIDSKKGIKASAFHGMKVLAGTSFRVSAMEFILTKGSERVAVIIGTGNDVPNMTYSKAGHRIVIVIKRVVKDTSTGVREVAFKNGIINIPIL